MLPSKSYIIFSPYNLAVNAFWLCVCVSNGQILSFSGGYPVFPTLLFKALLCFVFSPKCSIWFSIKQCVMYSYSTPKCWVCFFALFLIPASISHVLWEAAGYSSTIKSLSPNWETRLDFHIADFDLLGSCSCVPLGSESLNEKPICLPQTK